MTGGFKLLRSKAARQAVPLTALLELTHRCHLRCTHCYLDRTATPDELSTAEWMRVIDELADAGTLFIALSGGEPFLRPDVLDIAEHARQRGLALRLFTSGTLLQRHQVERLVRIAPVAVELSLYSARARIHDEITTVPGSHRRTLRAAVMLRRSGIPVVIKSPILRPNFTEIEPLHRVAERLGASARLDPVVLPRRGVHPEPPSLRPTPEELSMILARNDLQDPARPLLCPPRDPAEFVCGIARTGPLIGPSGNVHPCTVYPIPGGNVRTQRFADVWFGSRLFQALRNATVGSLHGTCATCEKNGYCSRCSALALLEQGDGRGPSDAACGLARAKELAARMMEARQRPASNNHGHPVCCPQGHAAVEV